MEAGCLNPLITRIVEPDYAPLTTNIELECKRKVPYFVMDFGELALDGLVGTVALVDTSATPGADLRRSSTQLVLQHLISKQLLQTGRWKTLRAPLN